MFFSPYLGVGGGGLPRGLGHNLLMQFSSLGSSKMEISETDFFDTLTIQNDQISFVKHVLAPLYGVFTLFGCGEGGGLPRGLGHNLLMQFSSLGSSKMDISETEFFDILTIQNDQISCIKHVLAPLYVFFTLFGCFGGGGGGSQGAGAQPGYAVLQPRQLKNGPSSLFEVPCQRQYKFPYDMHLKMTSISWRSL